MTIDTATTALLVIDALTSSEPDAVYELPADEARFAENCVRLARAARAAGMPVIFTNDDHIEGVDKELELWGPHGIHGKVTTFPELEAGTGARDFIIPKRRYSGFFGTDLDLLLRELASARSSPWARTPTSAFCIPWPTPTSWATTPSCPRTPRAPSCAVRRRLASSTS